MKPCKHQSQQANCRPCQLYATDARYRRLWSDPVNSVQRWYLLNLARRPDRLASASAQLDKAGIDWQRWEAVDGSALPLPPNENKGSGAYGCRLSHLRIMEDALTNGLDCVGVLEDDVVIGDPDNFQTSVASAISRLPEDWDMLYLGGQHRTASSPVSEGIVRCNDCHRTHSYIVRGQAIAKLYQVWSSHTGHVDHILRDSGSFQKLKAYAVEPWLTGQAESKSDINGKTNPEKWWDSKPRAKGCTACQAAREARAAKLLARKK